MDTGLSKRLSHAYIIAARPDAGFDRALLLARRLLCSGAGPRPCGACRDCRKVWQGVHPDVIDGLIREQLSYYKEIVRTRGLTGLIEDFGA